MRLAKWYRGAKQLAALLDSLGFYYNLVLATLFLWGVYAVFANEPPTAVSLAASPAAYKLWVAWNIVAAPLSWLGQWTPNPRLGWWLRWAGDSTMSVLITTHVFALHALIDRGVYGASSGYLVFISALVALVWYCLTLRDLIKAVSVSRGCHSNDD